MINSLSAADLLVVTLKNKNLCQTKNAQVFFLFFLNETKYNHFAITYKTAILIAETVV